MKTESMGQGFLNTSHPTGSAQDPEILLDSMVDDEDYDIHSEDDSENDKHTIEEAFLAEHGVGEICTARQPLYQSVHRIQEATDSNHEQECQSQIQTGKKSGPPHCESCGINLSSKSAKKTQQDSEQLLCRHCDKLLQSKQYCGICKKIWPTTDGGSWVCCDACQVWVHAECDETLNNLKDLESIEYLCPGCRPKFQLSITENKNSQVRYGQISRQDILSDKITVCCLGVEGTYLAREKVVLCHCGSCTQRLSLNEWERHAGSRTKNWRSTIKVKSTMKPLGKWVEQYNSLSVSHPRRLSLKVRTQKLLAALQEPYKPEYPTWTTERCAVCRWDEDWDYNKIIICNRCQIGVHQECYGVSNVQDFTSWVCRACETKHKQECCLCPLKGGALKPTDVDTLWVHVTCAWFQPDVSFSSDETMEPAVCIPSIPMESFYKICVICKQMHGACTRCHRCSTYYHAMCASRAGYRMELHSLEKNGKPITKMISYCARHRETSDRSHDTKVIQMQVSEDQKLLREKVLHLSGVAGIERMESALSDTRTEFFKAKESGDPLTGVLHVPSTSLSSTSTQLHDPVHKKPLIETNESSGTVARSLFGTTSLPNFDTEAQAVEVHLPCATGNHLPTENELLVNEIIHGGVGTINYDNNVGDAIDIQAKIKVTMETAFWDGIIESLKQHEPDIVRIVKLVKEVRDELCDMAPQNWKQEILNSFDLDILSQVLESGMQDTDYLGRILEYSLVMLQKLSAPVNEDKVKKAHKDLQNELAGIAQSSDDKSNSSFVLATVMGLRFVLEQIQTLKKEISKARIQLLEPIIKGFPGLEYLQKAFADRYGPPSTANFLPLTVRWITSIGARWEEEKNEHTSSLSVSSMNNGLPLVTTLRTGGSVPLASNQTPPDASDGGEQRECNGEKIDILVRIGLLELASGIEGLTVDTVPETFKLNALRLRAVQSQLQRIIVVTTSMLVLRQILISENVSLSPSELESITSDSFKRLSELLERVADPGIEEIVDVVTGSAFEPELKGNKEVMARLLVKSLQSNDAVFTRVSRAVYLAARGVVLGGCGDRGRRLADGALQRVGASMLVDLVVKAAEPLIVMANVSAHVHGPWYRSLV